MILSITRRFSSLQMKSTAFDRYTNALQYLEQYEETRCRNANELHESQEWLDIKLRFKQANNCLDVSEVSTSVYHPVTRPHSAIECRRMRAIDRFNSKVASDCQMICETSSVGLTVSRESSTYGSRPSTGLASLRRLSSYRITYYPNQMAIHSNRNTNEIATLEAYYRNEETMLLRSYRILWEECYQQCETFLSKSIVGHLSPEAYEYLMKDLSTLSHSLILIRSIELKARFRKGFRGMPQAVEIRKSLLTAKNLLGSLWLISKGLSDPTPKGINQVLRVSTFNSQCVDSMAKETTISLHQASTLIYFRCIFVRIQSIWRGALVRRRYRRLLV